MYYIALTTGRSVSQQYAVARDEARDHARTRNAYFQQVTCSLCPFIC